MSLPDFDKVTERTRLNAAEWDALRALFAKACVSQDESEWDFERLTKPELHLLHLGSQVRPRSGPARPGRLRGGLVAGGACRDLRGRPSPSR